MHYKRDWDMAKKRLTAFWDRDILDRCCISVKVPGQAAQAMPQTQCRFLQYPLYHLDGAEQIRHLDDLLSIPELRAIQWTQVAGQPPCTQYLPELKRIQAAGKNLVILVEPKQVEVLLENLSSRGLLLVTTVPTVEDAEALLRQAEKLTHD